MTAAVDIHAELDALKAQFVVVHERIFDGLDYPAAAEVSDELLCIADCIEEVRDDLVMMGSWNRDPRSRRRSRNWIEECARRTCLALRVDFYEPELQFLIVGAGSRPALERRSSWPDGPSALHKRAAAHGGCGALGLWGSLVGFQTERGKTCRSRFLR